MQNYPKYEVWNNKQIKEFHKELKKQFGFEGKLDYVFLSNKDKIYIVSKDFEKLSLRNINNAGLYIAKHDLGCLRLSIEGSQLIGPKCTKNILDLQDPADWMQGKEIATEKIFKNAVIIKFQNDFLGSGIYKNKRILNFIPKSRRIR